MFLPNLCTIKVPEVIISICDFLYYGNCTVCSFCTLKSAEIKQIPIKWLLRLIHAFQERFTHIFYVLGYDYIRPLEAISAAACCI